MFYIFVKRFLVRLFKLKLNKCWCRNYLWLKILPPPDVVLHLQTDHHWFIFLSLMSFHTSPSQPQEWINTHTDTHWSSCVSVAFCPSLRWVPAASHFKSLLLNSSPHASAAEAHESWETFCSVLTWQSCSCSLSQTQRAVQSEGSYVSLHTDTVFNH